MSAKYTAPRVFRWLAIQGAFGASAYFGIFRHIEWCDNIFVFISWLNAILLTFAVFADEVKKTMTDPGRPVPRWLSVTFDISVILSLAAVGRFGMASLWAWQASCEIAVYAEWDKKET